MANQVCVVCEQRPAVVLATLLETGDTQYVCLFCAPWWVQGLWQANGLPELILDVADADAEAMGDQLPDAAAGGEPAPADAGPPEAMTDAEWEASGAEGRPVGPVAEPAEETTEAPPAEQASA